MQKSRGRVSRLQKEILAQSGKKEQIHRCLNELRNCGDILEDFDVELWNSMVESMTVSTDKMLEFLFRDKTKILITIPEKAK